MFSQSNPAIVHIRRELRGQLPDDWLEDVITILEYQLTYQTIDELPTNDLLKLRLASGFSETLNRALASQLQPPQTKPETRQEIRVASTKPPQFRLPWQQ